MSRPTVAEINTAAIKKNLKKLKSLSKDALFYPVVKANAYGHGYKAVTKEIESLVHGLSVATTEEALSLRKVTKNLTCFGNFRVLNSKMKINIFLPYKEDFNSRRQ